MATTNIGAVPTKAKKTLLTAGDRWSETVYFGPGLDADTEFMTAFPVGMELAGVLHAIRETKAERAEQRREYLCMEDFQGNLFRVAAPGQLAYLAAQVIGKPISILYKGKEHVERLKREVHQFEVAVLENVQ